MRLMHKGRFSQRHLANCKSLLISFFYFIYQCEFDNVLHKDNIDFCTRFRKKSSHDFILSTDDLVYHVPDNYLIKIADAIHLSSMKKNNDINVSITIIPSRKRLSKNVLINEEFLISCGIFKSLHSFISSRKTPDIFKLNRVGGNVEFIVHPQHETSFDSEIQTKKVLKRKFRKQLGRLSIILLNSKDKAYEGQC